MAIVRGSHAVGSVADLTAGQAPAAGGSSVPPRGRSRWSRADLIGLGILVVLPVLIFAVPALLGHAVVPGDDLTQNYPLRVLAGRQIAAGQLPLFDPYIWSGAPLLGDWNAGALYPLTLLFAALPGVAAWTLGLIITWVVTGVGLFCFLRALRLASLASFLGALSFAFAGAMSAQVGHFGLVAGMSWVPVELLAVLRLAETRSLASRLRWISVLAVTFGLTILAGEPRAVDDAGVLVGLYALWLVVRSGRRCVPLLLSVAAGLGLAVCLGAVQLLPGLSAIGASQRGASTFGLFSSGSLAPRWLLLMLVPNLLGGSGSFGQPAFFANYNLAEVTSYVGILPLVAALALLSRIRLRRPPPEWLVWHVIALVGVVFALGGKTPLGHIFAQLPLFGSQRLQSRNILIADLALAVLLAYWVDDPFWARRVTGPGGRARASRLNPELILSLLPPLGILVVVVAGIWSPATLLSWLGVSAGAIQGEGSLVSSLLPYALLAAGAVVLILALRRLELRRWAPLAAGFVAVDVIVFSVLAVVAVMPGTRHSTAAASRAAQESLKESRAQAPVRPISELGFSGRFAIYDPGLRDAAELPVLGSPDLNVISSLPSVQGYSSIVNGAYAAATGSHSAMGDGQDVLSPRAIGNRVLAQLNTSVLLTLPAYLVTPAGQPPATSAPQTGHRYVAVGQRATWYLGEALGVSAVTVPDTAALAGASGGTQLGLVLPSGAVRWFRTQAVTAGALSIHLGRPVISVGVVARAGKSAARLGPPTVAEQSGAKVVADGALANALTTPAWGVAGFDHSFAIFADHAAAGALSVAGLSGGRAPRATARALAGPADAPSSVAVSSPAGFRLTRSVAAIPGWTATWHPSAGPSAQLTVHSSGIVQSVDVPAGRGVVTWSYIPPRFVSGVVLSLFAILVLLVLSFSGRWLRLFRAVLRSWPAVLSRRSRSSTKRPDPKSPAR